MAKLHDFVSDQASLVALQPEEVALLVLQVLVEQERTNSNGPPNRHNFGIGWNNQLGPDAIKVVMEGWAWLESSGCIAPLAGRDGCWFVTRRGRQLVTANGVAAFTLDQALPKHLLHPQIEQSARSAFLRGEFDTAVFVAFKQLEVAIREAGGYSDNDIGVDLVRKAFNVDNGPLTELTAVMSERQALSNIMAGAIGSYKNPHSHRKVAITDPTEAAEMVILASHLIKIVDARRPPAIVPASE